MKNLVIDHNILHQRLFEGVLYMFISFLTEHSLVLYGCCQVFCVRPWLRPFRVSWFYFVRLERGQRLFNL